jgi:CRISPR system Cascade subunit CasB
MFLWLQYIKYSKRRVMKMSRGDTVYNYMASKIEYINSLSETGQGKALLAKLRHGVGEKPGESVQLWGIVFDKMPEELLGKREASNAEWAIYTALTLYALHRQGKVENVNAKGVSVGSAAAQLVKSDEDLERVINRLNVVATSVTIQDLAYRLKGVIQLLRNGDIKLDYARLAKEIYLFGNPDDSASVKLSWGRDFYKERTKKEEANKGKTNADKKGED